MGTGSEVGRDGTAYLGQDPRFKYCSLCHMCCERFSPSNKDLTFNGISEESGVWGLHVFAVEGAASKQKLSSVRGYTDCGITIKTKVCNGEMT